MGDTFADFAQYRTLHAPNIGEASPRARNKALDGQSAICLLIAATYTPFISQLSDANFATQFLMGVRALRLRAPWSLR
jgi:predicted membrane channel-forming protein YqfA (hemolysin III family)